MTVVPVVLAQPPASAQRRWIFLYGDWEFNVAFDGREMQSILTFSSDEEGNRIAHMISF